MENLLDSFEHAAFSTFGIFVGPVWRNDRAIGSETKCLWFDPQTSLLVFFPFGTVELQRHRFMTE